MTDSAVGPCSVLRPLHTDFSLNEILASGSSGVPSAVVASLEDDLEA